MPYNIVLIEPEIPNNTGNIGRISLGTASHLHLVKPFGFELSDSRLKRAGLDYWKHIKCTIYESVEDFFEQHDTKKMAFLSSNAPKNYLEIPFEDDLFLIFGKESVGLSSEILKNYPTQLYKIPLYSEHIKMYHLNAGYKDWFVSKDSGNGRLLMPIDKAQAFMKRLHRLDNDKWLRWKTIKSANQEGMESIASAYGISSRWLRKVNKLPTTGALPAGTDIRIPQPAYADKHYASRRPTGGWAGLRRDGTRNWHTVRRGESIWSISRRYTISMKQLKRWNPKLARQRFLQPGQKVAVWLPKKPVVRKSRERPASGIHTVRRGESLSRIAQRYGTSIRDLAQWNDLATNAKLQIGQSLRIGKSAGKMASADRNDSIRYTVRKGDSLWSIAQRYRVTIKKLLAWNNFNRPPRFLQPGQRLTIRR